MKTKLYRLVVLLFLFFSDVNAQAPAWAWAKGIGGPGADFCISIAIDTFGNVYSTGEFMGTVDFDPGPGVFSLTADTNGLRDVFICKLDNSGLFVWAKSVGGSFPDFATSIATDATGNIYSTGYFNGTADFDPDSLGVFSLTSTGFREIFILKLDSSGNFVWAKQIAGPSDDHSFSIALDASANIYITGNFGGTCDFDPNAGVFNLTSNGNDDIFIDKIDSSGNFIWAKSMGGPYFDWGKFVTVDSYKNLYTTGRFSGTADFDPGAVGTFNLTSNGNDDIFISKLDSMGNFVWAISMGGPTADEGNSLKVDVFGSVYITGAFWGIVDFDPDALNIYNLNSNGSFNAFVLKIDSYGNFVWAKQIGGLSGLDAANGYSIVLDASSNVYFTGEFEGTVDLNPDTINILNFTSKGQRDIYVTKMDSSGNFEWTKTVGDTSLERAFSIFLDPAQSPCIAGEFYSPLTFDSTVILNNG